MNKDIWKFFIIHRGSGLCMFEQTFEELPGEMDSILISGYLYAILGLSQEIANQDIDYLQLQSLRFDYHISEQYLMVIVADNALSHEYLSEKLLDLQKKFDEQYKSLFSEEFKGDISHFRSFASVVESVLDLETINFQYIDPRQDRLKEYFQTAHRELADFTKLISDRARIFGQWTMKETLSISPKIKADIAEAHQEKSNVDSSEEQKQEHKKKGQWV